MNAVVPAVAAGLIAIVLGGCGIPSLTDGVPLPEDVAGAGPGSMKGLKKTYAAQEANSPPVASTPAPLTDEQAVEEALKAVQAKLGTDNDYKYRTSIENVAWAKRIIGFPNAKGMPDSEPICVVQVSGTTSPAMRLDVQTGRVERAPSTGYYYKTSIFRRRDLEPLYTVGNYSMTPVDGPRPGPTPPSVSR